MSPPDPSSPSTAMIDTYRRHAAATIEWLLRSERAGGGSAAYQAPLIGWSRAYPETTGYLIPTLLESGHLTGDDRLEAFAQRCGEWLLSIQNSDGSWNGSLHPPRTPRPSVFNTAQILFGLLALSRHSPTEKRWLESAALGADWLRQSMAPEGLWRIKDYRAAGTPSYYAHALWPLLDVAMTVGDERAIAAIEQSLALIAGRVADDGWIENVAFSEGEPAFTHTIAYTIRGLQGAARLLGDPNLERAFRPALEKLIRIGELRSGHLPGAMLPGWNVAGDYVCLTGNVQIANCILVLEEEEPDLRLVSAAARLVDVVCSSQQRMLKPGEPRGRVAGSLPLYGSYMRFRYPNWAAKYHIDALHALIGRLAREA